MIGRLLLAAVLSVLALALWASTTAQQGVLFTSLPTSGQATQNTHTVARVLDGDTIVLSSGEKVRYIGIDTPELYGGSRDAECFAKEAQKRNEDLVLGKQVRLESDVSETDKYGRLLRYVYLSEPTASLYENTSINEILVREGYAFARTYPPDVSQQKALVSAEVSAKTQKTGLWAENICK